jgi:hypothetical protein
MSDNIDYIGAHELIFNADKKTGISSGGFSVNSIMMKAGMSPIMTLNNQSGGSNKVSDLFENLVVPNWALSYSNNHIIGGSRVKDEEDEDTNDIDDDLHDKLLELVKEHDNKINDNKAKKIKRKTKKHKLDNNNNHKRATKRHKKLV